MKKEQISTQQLIRVFLKIRNAKAAATRAYEAKDAEFKASLKMVEAELLRRALEQEVEGFKVKGLGTAYTKEEMHVSIGDDKTFYQFCRDTGDLDFFERRITIKHVKEYMAANNGELPPGIHAFRENRMQVRAATEKRKGRINDDESDDSSDG